MHPGHTVEIGRRAEHPVAAVIRGLRRAVADVAAKAQEADATLDAHIPPFAPGAPLAAGPDLKAQADARVALAGEFEKLLRAADPASLARWANVDLPTIQAARQKVSEAGPYLQAMRGASFLVAVTFAKS